jgi:hypothetical protein
MGYAAQSSIASDMRMLVVATDVISVAPYAYGLVSYPYYRKISINKLEVWQALAVSLLQSKPCCPCIQTIMVATPQKHRHAYHVLLEFLMQP